MLTSFYACAEKALNAEVGWIWLCYYASENRENFVGRLTCLPTYNSLPLKIDGSHTGV